MKISVCTTIAVNIAIVLFWVCNTNPPPHFLYLVFLRIVCSCCPHWMPGPARVYTFRGTASLCKIASTFASSCLRSTACGRESHSNRSAIHKQTFWLCNYTCDSLVPRLLPCSLGTRLTCDTTNGGKLGVNNTGVNIPMFCVDSIISFSFCLLCLMRNFWQDLMVPTAKSHYLSG